MVIIQILLNNQYIVSAIKTLEKDIYFYILLHHCNTVVTQNFAFKLLVIDESPFSVLKETNALTNLAKVHYKFHIS